MSIGRLPWRFASESHEVVGGIPETTPASMCVALRLKSGTCRNGRVAVSFCCLYCPAVSFAFTLLRSPVWRCLSTQSGQRVWPAGLGSAHWTQRPSDLRSARTCARCCWFFFLYSSLRTLLGVWLTPRVFWSAVSFWICSINSAPIRGRGFMPFALRRFSESCRCHSRCFAAHSAQRVCPCTAAWPQRHRPCSLRSCRVRAGFCLRVDGCGFGAWAEFFWFGRVDFRLGPDFIRLRVRLGINMVSIKSCGFKVFIPVHAGRMMVGSVVRVVSGGHSPRSWRSWFSSSRTRASASSNVGMCSPVLGSYQPSWPSVQRRLRLRMVL